MYKKILTSSLATLLIATLGTNFSYATTANTSKNLNILSPKEVVFESYIPPKDQPGQGSNAYEIWASHVNTSNKYPKITGGVLSQCNDLAVTIFKDTELFATGEAVFSFRGQINDIPSSNGYKLWELDLGLYNSRLENGKYNINVSSSCGQSTGNPRYLNTHYDSIFIYPSACDGFCVPVHRFYNKQNGAHFYTSVEQEKRMVLIDGNYRYEGIANFARGYRDSGMKGVHRFYNMKNNTHFYTSNQVEATNVNNTMSHTYRYEGVAYSSYENQTKDRTPVHRFYKFKQGVHFYTSNQVEATNVNNTMSHTYRYEGVAYYNISNR